MDNNIIKIGVVTVIINKDNEILMMLRNKQPAKGLWAIPGGKVEFLENMENTIKRELKEELDIDVKVDRLLGNIEDIDTQKNEHWIMPAYTVSIISGIIKNMEPEKHEKIEWIRLDNVPENISYMTNEVLKLLKKY